MSISEEEFPGLGGRLTIQDETKIQETMADVLKTTVGPSLDTIPVITGASLTPIKRKLEIVRPRDVQIAILMHEMNSDEFFTMWDEWDDQFARQVELYPGQCDSHRGMRALHAWKALKITNI